MMKPACSQSVMVFTVMNREGQPIGEVVQPKAVPVIGRWAGTVLLVRDIRNGE